MRTPRGSSSKQVILRHSEHARCDCVTSAPIRAIPCAVFAPPRREMLVMQDPQSTQQQLSARGHPGTHRLNGLISSPPVKNAAGSRTTYYAFTGAVGRQTPLLLRPVGPVWHLKWLRPVAPLPCRLWPLWRTRRPGGWATTTFSLRSQKITCMHRNPSAVIGLVRPRRNSYLRILLVRRSLHQVHMHNVVISASRGAVALPTTCLHYPLSLGAACTSERPP